MREITEIIIHCSATPEGKDYTAADIDKWHRDKGWDGIGYHWVIYRDGTVVPGRSELIAGAHCKGHNKNSIGICYIGGLTADGKHGKDTRTIDQKLSMHDLLCGLKKRYPKATIHGHNEFAAKECPCFNVRAVVAHSLNLREY